jgi:hypothetical protein
MPFAQPEATAAATADLDSLTFRMPFIVNR